MTANGSTSKPTDRVRELARYIGDQPDQVSVNVHVGDTGRHRAQRVEPEPEDDTPTKPESEAPPSKLSPLVVVWLLVSKFPPWGAVAVAVAGIAAYVWLRR